jgi:predicted 2-oxoglutarate/Fe(II)-dependent dioxygenase YbiX
MHPDDSFATPRTTSLVYYPNDDYEGGELEFIHFGVKIKPKAGQLFLFPAGYSYEHKIHPVTGGGYRRTMVSFFNQMTNSELQNRHAAIDKNNFYKADLKYVLARDFGA